MTRCGFPLYGATTPPFLLWRLNSGEPYVRKVPVRFGGRGGSRPSLPLYARSRKCREATLFRADGVVRSAKSLGLKSFAELTTPSDALRRLRAFLLMPHPPLLPKELIVGKKERVENQNVELCAQVV